MQGDVNFDALQQEIAKETGQSLRNAKARSVIGKAQKQKQQAPEQKKANPLQKMLKGDVLTHTVIPCAVAFIFALIVGVLVGGSGKSTTQTYTNTDSVKGEVSVLDETESIKDAQVRALQKAISGLKGTTGTNTQGQAASNNEIQVSQVLSDASTKNDSAFDVLIQTPLDASDADIDAVAITASADSDVATASAVFGSLLKGNTPAKQLQKAVGKSGSVEAFYVSPAPNYTPDTKDPNYNPDLDVATTNSDTVLVFAVPCVTETDSYTAWYASTVTSSGIIKKIAYGGLTENTGDMNIFSAINGAS